MIDTRDMGNKSFHDSRSGFFRSSFFRDLNFLFSRIFSRTCPGRGVGIRGRLFRSLTVNFLLSISRAIFLFRSWVRSFWQTTLMPVGRCIKRTAVCRLFTFCPPGPLEQKVSTSHSTRSSEFKDGMRQVSLF